MNSNEAKIQLNSLIEHFKHGGLDFNATDISAIEILLEENKKYKEVINELRNYLKTRVEVCDNRLSTPFCNFEKTTKERLILSQCLEKLEELEVEHE